MKRALTVLGGALAAVLCFIAWRRHQPERVPLGFRCKHCGKPGDSYEDYDLPGYVSISRRLYDRDINGTRSTWEEM